MPLKAIDLNVESATQKKKSKKPKCRIDKNLLSFELEDQPSISINSPPLEREHKYARNDSKTKCNSEKLFGAPSTSAYTTIKLEEDRKPSEELESKRNLEYLTQKMHSLDTQPNKFFTIEKSESKGRCVVSCTRIKPGELILKEVPVVSVVNENHLSKRCFSCFKNRSKNATEDFKDSALQSQMTLSKKELLLSRCSKCKAAWYCSKPCQLRDWSTYHKKECDLFSKHKDPLPMSVRLMARTLILSKGRTPSFLESMISNRKLFSPQEIKKFGELSLLLHGFIDNSQLTASDLIDLWCKLQCNGFSICDDDQLDVGVGLFEKAASFNHSCKPNAFVHFDSQTLELRAIDDISVGEEITVAYIDVFEPLPLRKNNLLKQYFFTCFCEKCNQSEPTTRLDYFPCLFCKGALFIDEFTRIPKDKLDCDCKNEETFENLKSAYNAFKKATTLNTTDQNFKSIEEKLVELKLVEAAYQNYLIPEHHYFALQLSYSLISLTSEKIRLLVEASKLSQACKTFQELTQYILVYIDALKRAGATKFHAFISNVNFIQADACFQIWEYLARNEKHDALSKKGVQDYSEKLSDTLNLGLYNVTCTHGQQSLLYNQLSQFKLSLSSFNSMK